jgi:hypothetical protein
LVTAVADWNVANPVALFILEAYLHRFRLSYEFSVKMVTHMDGMSRPMWLLILVFLCVSVCGKKQAGIVQLNEDNWEQMLQGDWMIEL